MLQSRNPSEEAVPGFYFIKVLDLRYIWESALYHETNRHNQDVDHDGCIPAWLQQSA